ncbi:MAG: hypothetical protein M1469_01255 [Bacteroidetes bacterium]|nr:hypothetical protein [Bacteroidota bacterium]
MGLDKTKVYADIYEVFIAARVSPDTQVAQPTQATLDAYGDATWKHVGMMAEKSPSGGSTPNTNVLHDGTAKQLNQVWKLQLDAVQTDAANITLLESFLDTYNDAIFRVRGSSRAYRFDRCSVTTSYKHGDSKTANAVTVTFEKISKNISDGRTEITLV